MINAAITGHRPDAFLVSHYTTETIMRIADDIVWKLKNEYKELLILNLGGSIGADQWVGSACINNNVRFRLYLPFHPEIQTRHWTREQQLEFNRQMQSAAGIDIIDPDLEGEHNKNSYIERDKKMVDNSSFVVAFWVGRRRGETYQTIKYALEKSKFVFNALDGLRPIFNNDLEKGWTPPMVKNERI